MIDKIEITKKERQFIDAYIEAIYFTDTGDTGQPTSDAELDETFLRESVIDCLAFFSRIQCYLSEGQIEQAGHDFWLTRNGHGTGFWDRQGFYCENFSEMFTKIAESFGSTDSYF